MNDNNNNNNNSILDTATHALNTACFDSKANDHESVLVHHRDGHPGQIYRHHAGVIISKQIVRLIKGLFKIVAFMGYLHERGALFLWLFLFVCFLLL